MKRFVIVTFCVVLVVSALMLTLFTKTTTANADIAAGNQAFQTKDYDTALKRYTVAQLHAPDQAEPNYNTGNTYYRQNALEQAQQTLEQTLSRPSQTLAEFIHFNLGNIAYNGQKFDVAIGHYEEALRLKPDDRDAKYNLELALQQQQQKQDQQQQQDQKQNQDQKQQDQQQQQDQKQQDQQQNQDQKQPDQQNQAGGQQNQQQNQDQKPQDQQQNQDQKQPDQQNQAGGQNPQPKDQPQNQSPQPGQAGNQADPQNQQNQPPATGGQAQRGLTPEQARQLLAAIGGNSKTLMEQLQAQYYASGDYPEKDW